MRIVWDAFKGIVGIVFVAVVLTAVVVFGAIKFVGWLELEAQPIECVIVER